MSMRQLPIYKGTPSSPLDGVSGLAPNTACNRCAHSAGRSGTCMPHEGEAGGVLVLDSYPSPQEARSKRPLSSSIGMRLRQMAGKAGMEAAFATALRCPPKGAGAEAVANLAPGLTACSPYLAATIAEIKPRKIIALGSAAIYALTGSTINPHTMRGGLSWVHLPHGWVPVFYCISPAQAQKSKFLTEWMYQDFAAAIAATPATSPPVAGMGMANLVTNIPQASLTISRMASHRWVAVDAEWAGRPYDKDFKLLSVAMTPAPPHPDLLLPPDLSAPECNDAWVWTAEALANPETRRMLADWLRDPNIKKVGSYFKADTVAFHAALGIWTRGVVFDTRLARRMMDAEASGRLADMAHLVGRGGHKDELKEAMQSAVNEYRTAARKGKGGLFKLALPGLATQSHADKIMAGAEMERYGFAFVDPELLYRYNAADTVVTSLIGGLLEHRLSQEPHGMQNVAYKVALPASDTYARVESWGIRVDRQALLDAGTYIDSQLAELGERFVPYGYNPSDPKASTFLPTSPQQVGKLLYETLKLPQTRTTETGAAATDFDALEELAKTSPHPVVNDILAFRTLTKMKGTYVEGLLGHIRDDGRVHPTIHPDGARTGRTSSSDPNLQNIPSIESNDQQQAFLARMVRGAFAPPEGFALLECDFSQLELRVAADLSGDPGMLEIFKQGQDYHLRTAHMLSKTLWGITPEEVTDTHRREVKACIAEGSLVLTSNGLKEIEAVALDDLVWDGVEWVSHEGVVCNGVREVITYDGLTATPDHIVFTACGREIGLSLAAQAGCRLAVTEVAGSGLRYSPFGGDAVSCQVSLVHSDNLHGMSSEKSYQCRQHVAAAMQELPLHDSSACVAGWQASVIRQTSTDSIKKICGDCSKDEQSCMRCLASIWRKGDSEQVLRNTGICGVLPEELAASDVQRYADRPYRQQRQLRAGEFAVGSSDQKFEEYSQEPVLRIQRADGYLHGSLALDQDRLSRVQPYKQTSCCIGLCKSAIREHTCQKAAQALGQARVKVYDILNAGPRHRFTVSGRLVHNCNFALLFDDDPYGIAMRLGTNKDKATQLRDAVFGCFPLLAKWIKERVAETMRTGYAWTWWDGEAARRRPLIEVANADSPAGRTARRGSWNTPIQGTGNEYLVASANQVVEWLVADGIPAKLLCTIHDSMLLEVRRDYMSEVHATVLGMMCGHRTKNGVPLVADAKVGWNWASMQKWKPGQPCPLEGCL